MNTVSIQRGVSGSIVPNKNIPTANEKTDIIIKFRKLVFVRKIPPIALPATEPNIIGVKIKPAFVAEPP